MSASYSLKDLKQMGKNIANKNKVSTLIASSDGQFFLPTATNAANIHKVKKGVTLYNIDYAAQQEEPTQDADKSTTSKPSAQDRIENIKSQTDIAVIENLLKDETAKTVIAAGQARQLELKELAAQADEQEGRTE
jgi:hypothetical protein